jgi:cobalt-zinc-cadmium efflux system membrane fusion protein
LNQQSTPSVKPGWTGFFKNQLPTLLTLGLLGGLALWGTLNDWKLPWSSKESATSDDPLSEVRVISDSTDPEENGSKPGSSLIPLASKRIEFPSAEAVSKAGIRVEPVQVRRMVRYITVNGMVDYDPARYARLTSRASGSDLRGLTVERLEAAHKRGAVSEQSLREAQAALSEARIRLSNDHQRLLNFGLPVRLDDLTKVPHATGEIIEKNQPKIMFVLADVRHLHVDLDVNPEDMGLVRAGMEVTFTPTYMLQKSEIRNPKSEKRGDSNYGSETPDFTCVTAKVSHISPEVDEKTRRVKVHAEFDNSDGRLRPNDFGIGRIFIREEPKALVVPSEAVQSDGGSSVVFVRTSDNKSFGVRPVHTGLRDGNVIEVRGVQAGEEVATTGSFALLSELLKERIIAGD